MRRMSDAAISEDINMNLEEQIIEDIKKLADAESAAHFQRFFKTGKGEYADGDLFYGLSSPQMKGIVKKHLKSADLDTIEKLLHNPYHEARCVALFLMVSIYDKAQADVKHEIYDIYLRNVEYINNWDLVDVSCYKIIGRHIFESRDFSDIYNLVNTNHLWSNRIAVVSTMYLIKKDEFDLILELSEKFLTHKHDLMHKAVGWMLREMGKRDVEILYAFLDKHHKVMPRTMLRYSIEKLTPEKTEVNTQTLWGSIGWATPAAFGGQMAAKERRTILLTGEGSHQLTAMEISNMMHQGLKPIVIVFNNSGYTIERILSNDPWDFFNEVITWDYSKLPEVFKGDVWIGQARTNAEFNRVLKQAEIEQKNRMCYIEIFTGKMDLPTITQRIIENMKVG